MPFGVLLSGRRPLTTPTQSLSPTSFVYTLPSTPAFSHIVVFLLPDIVLPPDTAAAVYLSVSPLVRQSHAANPNFRLLGAIGAGKESAIFKVDNLLRLDKMHAIASEGIAEVDMDRPEDATSTSSQTPPQTEVTLGIEIKPASSVAAQLASLGQTKDPSSRVAQVQALQAISSTGQNANETLLLAQKIIRHAFNYLASFGDQMIPLKAFEGWWAKFETRLKNEPGFLDKVGD